MSGFYFMGGVADGKRINADPNQQWRCLVPPANQTAFEESFSEDRYIEIHDYNPRIFSSSFSGQFCVFVLQGMPESEIIPRVERLLSRVSPLPNREQVMWYRAKPKRIPNAVALMQDSPDKDL